MKRTIIIPVAVCGLLMAGCTGSTPSGRTADEKSPLEPYLGHSPLNHGFGMQEAGSAEASDLDAGEKNKLRKVEELTAKCMRAEGFEYVPYSPDEQPESEFDSAFSLPPEDFVRKYGYGITTLMPEQMGGEEADDPNRKIRDELTAKAQKAYDKALHGSVAVMSSSGSGGETVLTEASPGGTGKPADLGCSGEASEDVYGKPEEADGEDDEFQDLWEGLDALNQRYERNPKVVAATQEWSDCMADAGHTGLKKPQDPPDRVFEKSYPAPPSGDKPDKVKVHQPKKASPKLQAYEREIAVADFECHAKHLDKVQDEVGRALEQEFLDDHRDQLERFKESFGKRGGVG